MPGVTIRGLTKRYGDVAAVRGLDLQVKPGELVALLGPSGCGKTTTLRLVAGFLKPEAGEIWVGERCLSSATTVIPPERRRMAMIFQSYALWPHMTVAQNIAYGLRFNGVPRGERERRVRDMLRVVQLEGYGSRYPGELSGGQQQRVAVARALVVEPEILLLDEPLSNLDAKLRESLRWELRALQRRLGMTFVYVTHDQDEALSLSDWIAVMNAGRVEQAGTPWDIYYRPRTAFLADFVGAVNLVPAAVREVRDGMAAVSVGDRTAQVRVPDGLSLSVPGEVRLCIRPESLALRAAGSGAEGELLVAGTVARRAFLGDLMRYWVLVDGREWIVDQPDPGAATLLDGAVSVAVRPERIHLIVA